MVESQIEGLRKALTKRQAPTRILAVASGKGGVGKTAIALNLALGLSTRGQRTLLVDGDPGMADLHILLGQGPGRNWGNAIAGECTFPEAVMRNIHGIDFLAGFSGYSGAGDVLGGVAPRLLEGLRNMPEYAFQVIDLGAGISQPVLELAAAADSVLLVLGPELTALADAYGFYKTLLAKSPQAKVDVVVNGAHDFDEALRVHSNLAKIARQFLKTQPAMLASLPHDPAVPRALARQLPIMVGVPDSPFVKALGGLLDVLTKPGKGN